ncbi:DUF1285 domain-containing protein [Glaciecola sp. 33A]|uniref:DUF1285 domain-containing protein n=1 Tax=Glaciecola sp. 33A TaxID=2057807 RepID=UPI000C327F3D|nr:DUF1285 domain-containing protein [Glaciecola sp. 33A]PKI03265.1 DUF1285 domain-containing protein [Glaciecola sp. 33A]
MDLGKLTQQLGNTSATRQIPPVEKWDPPFCGDMNLVIKSNGEWWHEGTPFTRAKLVSLLSSVLKKEDDAYFLVTPVEKIGIKVEDVPFIVVNWRFEKGALLVKTQIGDEVDVGDNHPIQLRPFTPDGNNVGIGATLVPYCLIRRNLWARLHQNVMYQWAEIATETGTDRGKELIMKSNQYEFSLGVF